MVLCRMSPQTEVMEWQSFLGRRAGAQGPGGVRAQRGGGEDPPLRPEGGGGDIGPYDRDARGVHHRIWCELSFEPLGSLGLRV
jgi:hypothetical protein